MHILEILTDEMKCTSFFLSIGIIISPSDVYFLSYNGFSGACESAAESLLTSHSYQKFVYFYAVNNNKYFSHVVDKLPKIIIFGISVPDYPSRTVESNPLRSFWNFSILFTLYSYT